MIHDDVMKMEIRMFKPTFVLSVCVNEDSIVTAGTGSNGQPFASVKAAKIARDGRPDSKQTLVAFGPAAAVLASMQIGQPVKLAVQNKGGTLRVIGLPREKIAA